MRAHFAGGGGGRGIGWANFFRIRVTKMAFQTRQCSLCGEIILTLIMILPSS